MRHRVGKGFQLLVARLELDASPRELVVEMAHFLFATLAVADVIGGGQYRDRLSSAVALKRPAARDHDRRTVGAGLLNLPVPAVVPQQLGVDDSERYWELRLQELVSVLSDCLVRRPPEQLFGSPIPVGNDVVHVPDEDAVVREVEQARLLGSFRYFLRELIPRLQQLALHAVANRAERGNERAKRDEEPEKRKLRLGNAERIAR